MSEFWINSIIYTFYGTAVIQLIFMVIVFPRMLFFHKSKNDNSLPEEGVSIVIAAKDEYQNLKNFLPKILAQDYPEFEVIVVNNGADDDSEFLLKELSGKYPQLKSINVHSNANFFNGKKFPLSIGIKSAKYDLLILTDADCMPASNNWIRKIQSTYKPNTQIVLGYGAYQEKQGFLNKLIRFDTIRIAINYLALASWGMPYMGVGRNLSYRKSLFYAEKGFMSHYKIASGDDDLFINHAAKAKNTQITLDAEAKTISIPKENFREWYKQKRRHLTTGKRYKIAHLIVLGLWEISSLFYLILIVLMLFLTIKFSLVLYFIGFRTIILLVLIKKFMILQNERKLLLLSPLLEVIIILLGPIITMSNLLLKQRKWK